MNKSVLQVPARGLLQKKQKNCNHHFLQHCWCLFWSVLAFKFPINVIYSKDEHPLCDNCNISNLALTEHWFKGKFSNLLFTFMEELKSAGKELMWKQ